MYSRSQKRLSARLAIVQKTLNYDEGLLFSDDVIITVFFFLHFVMIIILLTMLVAGDRASSPHYNSWSQCGQLLCAVLWMREIGKKKGE